jgi:peptidoglycan/xylan/chitin deacetylase (PgdA/CDA1 family)
MNSRKVAIAWSAIRSSSNGGPELPLATMRGCAAGNADKVAAKVASSTNRIGTPSPNRPAELPPVRTFRVESVPTSPAVHRPRGLPWHGDESLFGGPGLLGRVPLVAKLTRRELLGAAALVTAAGCSTSTRRAAESPPSSAPAVGSQRPSSGAGSSSPVPPTPSVATSPAPTGPAAFVANGPRDRPEVALTFHAAGDLTLAERLLTLVEGAGVPVTVFAVGSWLAANPAQVARITRGGHELANHTYTHPTLGSLGPAAVLDEITRCRDVIARLSGAPGGRWFRPSAMDTPTPVVSAQAGVAGYATIIGYDVDSRDFTDPGAAAVTTRTLDGVRNGSIVSMHFDHRNTIDALPEVLAGLKAKGLTPVTVSRLLRA